MEIHKQTTVVDNLGTIKGKIKISSDQTGPVTVLHFRDDDGIPVLVKQVLANEKGEYQFHSNAGKHYIAAFIDVNNDNRYQAQEHGNYTRNAEAIHLAPKETITIDPILISGPVPGSITNIKPMDKTMAIWKNIGKVVTMADPRFTPENYSNGLWKPLDFLKQAEGGLFLLQAYNSDKIPVLLVHGVNNGPPLWMQVVDSMDDEYFQPWVYYYPSGLRLDMISDYLVEAVSQLQNALGFSKFYVVAHSMGGLVTRSFVKKYVERNPKNLKNLGLVMTVNSPMAGMAAAASGVNRSPIVVPSWRDVAPDSDFLQGITQWNWPEEIPYHLVISYLEDESGDGVVPIQSQAQWKLQTEATRIYIFNQEHTRIINSKKFHALLNDLFKKH